jgi:tetratricopeptide (TPR) repeat protein
LTIVKYIILFLFFSLCTADSYAQTNVKDSLQILLQKEKQDTSRVILLTELSFEYSGNKPDTAMVLAMEALSLSQRIGFFKGQAASFNRIGTAYEALGNSSKAMAFYIKALKLNEKIENLRGIARNLNNIGNIYLDQGEYSQAIDYYLKSKKLAEQINSKEGIAVSLGNLGRSYLGLKQYDTARVYLQQAYEVASKFNYDNRTGNLLALMGSIYSETGQRKLAMEYYRLSIPYLKLTERKGGLSRTFIGMAKLFEKEGQVDSTLFYANQAFEINRGAGFTQSVLDASNFLSSFYNNKGNIDSAFFYLKLSTVAKDSLSSKEKINEFQSLSFDEKLRQKEITAAEIKGKQERKHNLQFAAIAIGLITFIILFFAFSRSIIVKTKFIEFFGVLGLLAVFEFINLFIHPYLAHFTNDSPVLMLLILIGIGALLVPLHHRLEKWITNVMVEKNKKIRLAAAKRTIDQLENKAVIL